MTTTITAPETAPTTAPAGALELAPKVLADALAAVKSATNPRSALAALAGVRIYTRGGSAFMETTDLEITARKRLDATISGDFDALVSHADLSKAAKLYAKRASVRLEPAPRVVESFDTERAIESEMRERGHGAHVVPDWHSRNGYVAKRGAARDVLAYVSAAFDVMDLPPRTVDDVRVTDGKRTITLQSFKLDDFPVFPPVAEMPLLYTERACDLANVLERAAAFASKDETRPILTGIAFNYAGDTTRIWATDSYRLCDLAAPGHSTHRPKPKDPRAAIVNVPARGLTMAAKMMRKLTTSVSISTAGAVKVGSLSEATYAIVRHDGMEWAIRTLDGAGAYPQFDQLVPDHHEVELEVPTSALAGACDVAQAFARQNAPMRLSLNGAVKVSGSTPDVAEFEELLDGATYADVGTYMAANDHEFVIGLNPDFVAAIAKVHVSDTARLRLIAPLRPVLFIDGEDRYLLMPVRLKD